MSSFRARIEEGPRGGSHVRVPVQVLGELGGGGRIPVVATFDGLPYRGSIVRMGGESILGLLKGIRDDLGKSHGDVIEVTVSTDREPREVEIPPESATLLKADPAAAEVFRAFSYSHRREHAMYVAEAKKPETRERRAHKTVETITG